MKTDFFITYHHNDELAARWIAAVLREVPFSTFMDSWDFLPGHHPLEKIEHMMAISRSAMVLLSERFLQAGVDAVSWQAVMEKFPGSDTPSIIFLRIASCDVERVLGDVTYTDLAGIKETEARKRLLTAVSTPTADKKEPEPFPDTAMTRDEVLEKRKTDLDELLKTTIKHYYHMKLDLEQEKEKEVVVKDKKTDEIEVRKQWVWEAVTLETVLTDGNNYLLVNPSGMGKTTFLTHAACELLDQARDYPIVPLLTTCIALNNREGSIENFIDRQVESFYNNAQTAAVQREWENLCVLLDALDQARDVDDIVSSLQPHDKHHYYKKAKIILSSRQNTADKVKAGFRKIRLKLPEADEVRHYLGEGNYKKLEGHIAASRELVTVPVLLEMLKIITEKGYEVSKLWNRSGLYTEFTRILIDQERSKPRFWQDSSTIRHFIENELEQALEKIAFFSLAENKILEIEKEKLVKYCETPEKKEALLNIGIILELFEDREQKIVFRHQSFQAYFAARYLYYRQPELFQKLTCDIRYFYNDVWYELMRFFVGLEKDPQKAGDIINSILIKDNGTNALKKHMRWGKGEYEFYDLNEALRLIFAVLLMSEVRLSIKKVHNLYEQLRVLLTNTRQYLNFFFSNIDKFNKSNDEQRRSLFNSFGPLVSDRNRDVRSAASEAFEKIVTTRDIPLLESLLRDKVLDIRCAAVGALGKIGTAQVIPLLEPLLRNNDWNIRHAAAEALGKIGTAQVIPLLELLLKDAIGNVKRAASEALVKIGAITHDYFPEYLIRNTLNTIYISETVFLEKYIKEKKISVLQCLLRVKDSWHYHAIVEALGKFFTVRDIPLLESLLKGKYIGAQCAAIEVLGIIGTYDHIPLLEPLLRIKNWDVQRTAATSIEQIYKLFSPELPIDDASPKKEKKEVLFIKTTPANPLHILHISDIHYSAEKDPSITRIFHEFLQDIQKWRRQQNNEKIQSVCLTGDIAHSGQKKQYASINEKINVILNTTGCSRDNLFIIPGNHDVREYDKISDQGKTTLEQVRENKIDIDSHVLNRFENYREFQEKFRHYYGFVETSGYINSLTEKPKGTPKPWYSRRLKNFPVRIIGLNSALFCLKNYSEYGKIRMGINQFHEAYFQGKPGNTSSDELVILLTHHPVNWLAENEYEDYTTLMERYAVIHLHGHIHRTKIRKLFSLAGSSYISVGTGSLYGEKGLGDINTYHIITLDFENGEVKVWARRWIPERGCWGVYDNDTNNTFPFPRECVAPTQSNKLATKNYKKTQKHKISTSNNSNH